jgi:uncharacterized protein YjbI with pentapeptide repeats
MNKTPTREQLDEAKIILLAGHKAFLESRGGAPIDFSFENLTGAYLIGTNLEGAVLSNGKFKNASLLEADFRKADFRGADFRGANNLDAAKNLNRAAARLDRTSGKTR